jgi:hypothetical protein
LPFAQLFGTIKTQATSASAGMGRDGIRSAHYL